MKTIYDLLSEITFFSDMPPDKLEYVSGCGQNVHFKPGEYLGKEGDPANRFFVITKGKVAIELHHPIKGQLTIRTLGPGDLAVFSWIIPPYRMHFDLRALDHTSAISFDGKCVREKCDKDIELGYQLMKGFANEMDKRLKDTRLQLLDVYSTATRDYS
jgi:CRP-like cAMP-binding protein